MGERVGPKKRWGKNTDNENLSQNNDDAVVIKLYYPIKSTRKNRQDNNTHIN